MASELIGRTDCPECGEKNAHVKRSEKTTYRFCPECGAQYFPKNERQRQDLAKKTRLTNPAAAPAPAPEPAPAPGPHNTAPAAPAPMPARSWATL
jgi:ssDNA-binding Zn-finger/Zn-ribbon topoisomerase 1